MEKIFSGLSESWSILKKEVTGTKQIYAIVLSSVVETVLLSSKWK